MQGVRSLFITLRSVLTISFLVSATAYSLFATVRDGRVDEDFRVTPIRVDNLSKIECVAKLPDGRKLVGGSIRNISGGETSFIARLLPDGSFDPTFAGQADAPVLGIFPLSNGKILISGDFLQYAGVSRRRIARLNEDGSLDMSFTPSFGSDFVEILVVQGDEKIIIRRVVQVGGNPSNRLVRLLPDGTVDSTFDGGSGFPAGAPTKGVVQPDGKILLIGSFNMYNGADRQGIVRVNSDGSNDTSFVPISSSAGSITYFDIALNSDGRIYIVGDSVMSDLTVLNSDGTKYSGFPPNSVEASGGRIYSVALQGNKVIVGGDFDRFVIDGVSATGLYGLARFNPDGTIDRSFVGSTGSSGDGRVEVISEDEGQMFLLAGDFSSLNSESRGGIGRVTIDGSSDPAFQGFLGSPSFIYATHVFADGRVLVGGDFSAINGVFSANAAMLTPGGLVDPTFIVDSQVNSRISVIAVQPDGKILLGGYADTFGTLRKGIWRIHPNGTLDNSFDARLDSATSLNAIAIEPDGKILIGGNFTRVNGVERRCLARLNSNGSLDASYDARIGALRITSILRKPDGKVLIAGASFTSINGTPVGHIAQLNSDGSHSTEFNTGTGANSDIWAISIRADGRIYAAGSFTSFDQGSYHKVVRLNANGSVDPSFRSNFFSFTAYSLAELSNGKVLVGGSLASSVNAAPRRGIVRLLDNGRVDFSFEVSDVRVGTSSGEVYGLRPLSNGNVLVNGQFSSINGTARSGIARLGSFAKPTRGSFDFDGDGISDLSVYRPSTGNWIMRRSQVTALLSIANGLSTDIPAPGDYHGDYLSDQAVYRPSDGTWRIYDAEARTISTRTLGAGNDKPVPADYDGDGATDVAVFRQADGNWIIQQSRDGLVAVQYGAYGDLPVPGDYDGDGRADLAVFRALTNEWRILRSTSGETVYGLGGVNDMTVPADYDGDGKTDPGVFNPATASWQIVYSSTSQLGSFVHGSPGEIPVPADYDGDEEADPATFRASDGSWRILSSSGGSLDQTLGQNGDKPVPAAFVRQANFVSISGRVTTPAGSALRNLIVSVFDGATKVRSATTSSFGTYSLNNLVPGNYSIQVTSKRYRFTPQILQLTSNQGNVDFIGLE